MMTQFPKWSKEWRNYLVSKTNAEMCVEMCAKSIRKLFCMTFNLLTIPWLWWIHPPFWLHLHLSFSLWPCQEVPLCCRGMLCQNSCSLSLWHCILHLPPDLWYSANSLKPVSCRGAIDLWYSTNSIKAASCKGKLYVLQLLSHTSCNPGLHCVDHQICDTLYE